MSMFLYSSVNNAAIKKLADYIVECIENLSLSQVLSGEFFFFLLNTITMTQVYFIKISISNIIVPTFMVESIKNKQTKI